MKIQYRYWLEVLIKQLVFKGLLLVWLSSCALDIQAMCSTSKIAQTDDSRSVPIVFGTINMTSVYLQPVGSVLGRAVVSATDYNYAGARGNSALWECDAADLEQLQFLVATNGDDRVGGYWDLGAQDGMSNVYATYFRYVGIKQRMGTVTLSRYWQALPVNKYTKVGNKIQIRLQDLPTLYAELYRISQVPANAISNYCGSGESGTITIGSYSCMQPNAYIQLSGPGLIADHPGQDSAFHSVFWSVDNGLAFGMRGNQLKSEATCMARNITPSVVFSSITADALNQGQPLEAHFNVSIECLDQSASRTESQRMVIGIQVSEGAYRAARNLGLVNAENGVRALLSDDYGAEGIAQGVAIFLSNGLTGEDMMFVGQSNLSGHGTDAGWYPVSNAALVNTSGDTGTQHYLQNYTAILKRMDHKTVVAGKVSATAYVIVKLQ